MATKKSTVTQAIVNTPEPPRVDIRAVYQVEGDTATALMRWLKENVPDEMYRGFIAMRNMGCYIQDHTQFNGQISPDQNESIADSLIDGMNFLAKLS